MHEYYDGLGGVVGFAEVDFLSLAFSLAKPQIKAPNQ
jgi:hypothetical protein